MVWRDGRWTLPALACIVALTVWSQLPGPGRAPAATGRELSAGQRAAGLRFAAGVTPADRQTVLTAVASARPEARRLIAIVDGATIVRVGPTGAGAAGSARLSPGDYEVTLDLAAVFQRYGQRGVDRTVLHELAHVVDHAIVPSELATRLDASVARGWSTGRPVDGVSATREERFAESFAKWATGDIGVDLYLGYAVPPPPLDWGAPLAGLT